MRKFGTIQAHRENINPLSLESKKAEVHQESVAFKKRKITGHSLKARYKRLGEGNTVTETLSAKDENYGLVGSCIRSSKKMRTTCNSQEKEICSCNAAVKTEPDVSSVDKEKGIQREIDALIKQIQKKCDKRIQKLDRKQQRESQEFHQFWEEAKLSMERDHKLEADMIRYIYGEGPTRVVKLKLLDSDYRKKMEEHNLKKEAELKDLESRQLAARNLLSDQVARWLAEAKSTGNSEQTSQSDTDRCGFVNLTSSDGSPCDEIQAVELNREVPAKGSEDQVQVSLVSNDPEDTDTQDQMLESSVSATLVQECQASAPIEVLSSEIISTVQSPSEVQTTGNCEPLDPISTDVSPSCNPSSAAEVVHQNNDPVITTFQTAQAVEPSTVFHESTSRIERDSEIPRNCPDTRSLHGSVARDSSSADLSNVAVSTTEVANPSDPLLGIDADNFPGSSMVQHLNNNSNLPFLAADPLENELKNVGKEIENLDQCFKGKVSSLKVECEKEIQETIAQTRSRHDAKIKAAEEDFRSKMKDRQKNQNKVYANKVLADVIRIHTAREYRSIPRIKQGTALSSSHRQQLRPNSSACQLNPTSHTSAPPRSTSQYVSAISRNISGPNQHAMAQSGFHAPRPPPINSTGNLQFLGQSRSLAPPPPNYQGFRPGTSSLVYPASLPRLQSSMPFHPPTLAAPWPRPPWPRLPYSDLNHRAATGDGLTTALQRPSLSPQDLAVDRERLRPGDRALPPLPDISSTFGSLDSSFLEALGNHNSGMSW
ncbi:uncharacterized protein LOC127239453 isoform X2 [Andrographis paniculata]|uniref:uncharacterized protein LOC127239453 isoform X2 n=1 Tax=Andrographis paniculata TaxID=175694 RepID=UPI0021E8A491|nr:uncharacterized protein LOC127239453 isoform X2 [Andrographis paniculata]